MTKSLSLFSSQDSHSVRFDNASNRDTFGSSNQRKSSTKKTRDREKKARGRMVSLSRLKIKGWINACQRGGEVFYTNTIEKGAVRVFPTLACATTFEGNSKRTRENSFNKDVPRDKGTSGSKPKLKISVAISARALDKVRLTPEPSPAKACRKKLKSILFIIPMNRGSELNFEKVILVSKQCKEYHGHLGLRSQSHRMHGKKAAIEFEGKTSTRSSTIVKSLLPLN
ncbi:hypothetical protein Cgig2_011782 [Carnegiea gigantea]|uniref:Uncharacterized protein n=1 Tax=Carnegiea gigantea TaxID=171969 RepID=A0A9Q1Q4R8_9CARY|nr:hypothetical protein Cgig2_011782 [Carnegiea gigantea]